MSDVPPEVMRAAFTKLRDPAMFSRIMLATVPHDGQTAFLRNANAYINVLLPGNRWGKSTVIAQRHLHKLFFKLGVPFDDPVRWMDAEYETISLGHSADQAQIVFNMALKMSMNRVFRPFVKATRSTPFPEITLFNGAKLNCRSAADNGKYIDGHAYRHVSIDEAGWIDDLKDLMNGVIIMRLAGGGLIDLIGTPKGIGSGLYWYANRAMRGVDGYYYQRGSVFDNPYLPPEDIARRDELLKHSDPRLREQVIYGAFVSTEGLAFSQDELDNLFDPELPAHQDPIPGHRYYQAWDLGRKADHTVGMTFDITTKPYLLVDYVRVREVGWEAIYNLIAEKKQVYGVAMPRIDATGPMGDVVEEELWKRGIGVEGFKVNTGIIKTNLVNSLQAALSEGRWTIGERETVDEAGVVHVVPDLEPPNASGWRVEPFVPTRFVLEPPDPPHHWGLFRMPAIPQLLDEFGIYKPADKDLVQDSVMCAAMVAEALGSGLPAPVGGSMYG